jgi:hypothetical protein
MSTWREYFKPVIKILLAETKDLKPRERSQAFKKAYSDLGDIRGAHPYKIFRDEINRQLGKKKPAGYKQPLASKLPQLFN